MNTQISIDGNKLLSTLNTLRDETAPHKGLFLSRTPKPNTKRVARSVLGSFSEVHTWLANASATYATREEIKEVEATFTVPTEKLAGSDDWFLFEKVLSKAQEIGDSIEMGAREFILNIKARF